MTTAPPDLPLTAYEPVDGAFDEMLDRDGLPREHWSHLRDVFDRLGAAELARRSAEAANLLESEGVTYHAFGDGASRRWALDPIPLVLTSADWNGIETAVAQRAELLDLVLKDLYGPRQLISRRIIPPEIVFSHPGFLRQCDGIVLGGRFQLFTYGVDLARGPDGQRWVVADRTQAPSGAAYAAANRSVLSRVFPSLYRDAQVHRLAPFFRALRSGLQALAPRPRSEPRIVVLSPGPRSETAFEHGSLAAQLGCQLVEGSDLVVEGGRVWVRSLGHPEQVDVILRRVDSSWSDPLELRPDSFLGVPGLVEACRRRQVAVVNTLGSGILENPALMAYLQDLSEHLLGEQLALPSVPTWWCGEDASRSHVLANLERLVVKPIARSSGPTALFGPEMSSGELEELRRRIVQRPHEWVGQELLVASHSPTLAGSRVDARPGLVRAFAVAAGNSYLVMPGGLSRVSPGPAKRVSSHTGALSKDTWVLASEPERPIGHWMLSGPAVAATEPESLVSTRMAENLVWLGRYAERAEGVVRLLRVVHERRTEFADGMNPAGGACVRALLAALTHTTATYPGFVDDGAEERLADPGAELQSLAADAAREGTLAYSVARMLDAAHATRDHMSQDIWLIVSSLHRDLLDDPQLGRFTLRTGLASLLALEGLAYESMVREPGWWLMDAGRRLERAIHVATLLRSTVLSDHDEAADSLLMESLLTATESIITYRRRYRSHAQLQTLLDLLLLDPDNPRSVRFQLDRLAEDLAALPRPPGTRVSAAERPVVEASTALRLTDTSELAHRMADGRRADLDHFLAELVQSLERAAEAMESSYFAPQVAQRSFLTPADAGRSRTTQPLMP